jgi:hypothetical protein
MRTTAAGVLPSCPWVIVLVPLPLLMGMEGLIDVWPPPLGRAGPVVFARPSRPLPRLRGYLPHHRRERRRGT